MIVSQMDRSKEYVVNSGLLHCSRRWGLRHFKLVAPPPRGRLDPKIPTHNAPWPFPLSKELGIGGDRQEEDDHEGVHNGEPVDLGVGRIEVALAGAPMGRAVGNLHSTPRDIPSIMRPVVSSERPNRAW